jgi:hypothetical protein
MTNQYAVITLSAGIRLGILSEDGGELEHTATLRGVLAVAESVHTSLAAAQAAAAAAGEDRWVVDPEGATHYVPDAETYYADRHYVGGESVDPDSYNVFDYASGEELEGLPTKRLVAASLAAGDTGAVRATYDAEEALWDYVDPRDAQPEHVRTVFVRE